MKIIKQGKPNPYGWDQTYRLTCSHCDCIFEFQGSEIIKNNNQRDYDEYVICPNCGKNISTYRM